MNFTTRNDYKKSTGTCLQGYIDADFFDLVNLFGEPLEGDGYKVDAEWIIEFDNGEIATIYNYKDGYNYNGPETGTPTELITDWHIGGKSKKAVELVSDLLSRVSQ